MNVTRNSPPLRYRTAEILNKNLVQQIYLTCVRGYVCINLVISCVWYWIQVSLHILISNTIVTSQIDKDRKLKYWKDPRFKYTYWDLFRLGYHLYIERFGTLYVYPVQRKYTVKERKRRVRRPKMLPNLLNKLSWAPRKFVCVVYVLCVGGGGDGRAGRKLVSFRTHKS